MLAVFVVVMVTSGGAEMDLARAVVALLAVGSGALGCRVARRSADDGRPLLVRYKWPLILLAASLYGWLLWPVGLRLQ